MHSEGLFTPFFLSCVNDNWNVALMSLQHLESNSSSTTSCILTCPSRSEAPSKLTLEERGAPICLFVFLTFIFLSLLTPTTQMVCAGQTPNSHFMVRMNRSTVNSQAGLIKVRWSTRVTLRGLEHMFAVGDSAGRVWSDQGGAHGLLVGLSFPLLSKSCLMALGRCDFAQYSHACLRTKLGAGGIHTRGTYHRSHARMGMELFSRHYLGVMQYSCRGET